MNSNIEKVKVAINEINKSNPNEKDKKICALEDFIKTLPIKEQIISGFLAKDLDPNYKSGSINRIKYKYYPNGTIKFFDEKNNSVEDFINQCLNVNFEYFYDIGVQNIFAFVIHAISMSGGQIVNVLEYAANIMSTKIVDLIVLASNKDDVLNIIFNMKVPYIKDKYGNIRARVINLIVSNEITIPKYIDFNTLNASDIDLPIDVFDISQHFAIIGEETITYLEYVRRNFIPGYSNIYDAFKGIVYTDDMDKLVSSINNSYHIFISSPYLKIIKTLKYSAFTLEQLTESYLKINWDGKADLHKIFVDALIYKGFDKENFIFL